MIFILETQKYCVGVQQGQCDDVKRTGSIYQPLAIRPSNYFLSPLYIARAKKCWIGVQQREKIELILSHEQKVPPQTLFITLLVMISQEKFVLVQMFNYIDRSCTQDKN